jgi:hypothetical protein
MHTPGILGIGSPPDQAALLHAIDEFDGRMMPDQQEPRDVANRRRSGIDEPLDAKERLMLLGRQSLLLRSRLAEGEEDPQLVAKLRERLVVDRADLAVALDLRDA